MLQIVGLSLILSFIILGVAIDAGVLDGWDTGVFAVVNSGNYEALDSVMVILSLYGREVVWGALIVGLFIIGGEREKKMALTLGLIFLILIGVGYVSKTYYSRPRPYDVVDDLRLLVAKESDYNFPSGHTLIVAGGVVVAWLYLRRVWAALLSAEAALVAYSRIYVGVHYPSDVVGGVLLGAGCALIVCSETGLVDRLYDRLPKRLRG
jgi:membrane-associated phospholipid phosphatase